MQNKKPGKRRESREAAVQFLYSKAVNPDLSEKDLPAFWDVRPLRESRRSFAEELILGVIHHQEQIDSQLVDLLQNYSLERVNKIDLAILRMSVFEMCFGPQTPRAVCINEAIELAKRYSGEDSPRFINGILDKINYIASKNHL